MRVFLRIAISASAEADHQMVGQIDRGVVACITAVGNRRSAGRPLTAER